MIDDTKRGTGCACGSDCRECEKRAGTFLSKDFAGVDCLSSAAGENHIYLPGVVSRKKQFVPRVLGAIQQ